ncbi:MAG TPA: hypothetical protein VF571_16810 [Pyrinomonadaceae bacterium]|jgi:hypothetical protein
MSKGPKPPKQPPPPIPSDPENPPPNPPNVVCWTFIPLQTTSVINSLQIGDKAYGTFQGNRVLVSSEKGAIGYVPDSDAQEMINLATGTNRKLVGQILNNGGESEILIELCLL